MSPAQRARIVQAARERQEHATRVAAEAARKRRGRTLRERLRDAWRALVR